MEEKIFEIKGALLNQCDTFGYQGITSLDNSTRPIQTKPNP